jgi:hypothetical protein
MNSRLRTVLLAIPGVQRLTEMAAKVTSPQEGIWKLSSQFSVAVTSLSTEISSVSTQVAGVSSQLSETAANLSAQISSVSTQVAGVSSQVSETAANLSTQLSIVNEKLLLLDDKSENLSGLYESVAARAALWESRLAKMAVNGAATVNVGKPDSIPPTIHIEVSPGELIDKLTILDIKLESISDPSKIESRRHEHNLLTRARLQCLVETEELRKLTSELRSVNAELWRIEDSIRQSERAGDFGESFVALARSVYRTNDKRAALKRRINELLGSKIVEVKSYPGY